MLEEIASKLWVICQFLLNCYWKRYFKEFLIIMKLSKTVSNARTKENSPRVIFSVNVWFVIFAHVIRNWRLNGLLFRKKNHFLLVTFFWNSWKIRWELLKNTSYKTVIHVGVQYQKNTLVPFLTILEKMSKYSSWGSALRHNILNKIFLVLVHFWNEILRRFIIFKTVPLGGPRPSLRHCRLFFLIFATDFL